MNPDDAPNGSIAVVGHPANGVTARKDSSGKWRYTHGWDREVDYDTRYKGMNIIYTPGQKI